MMTALLCPRCGQTSHHPEDVYHRYCGACHQFVDDMVCLRIVVAGDSRPFVERWVDLAESLDRLVPVVNRIAAAGLDWAVEIVRPAAGICLRLTPSQAPDLFESGLSSWLSPVVR